MTVPRHEHDNASLDRPAEAPAAGGRAGRAGRGLLHRGLRGLRELLTDGPAPEPDPTEIGTEGAGDLSDWDASVAERKRVIFANTLRATCLVAIPLILAFALWDREVSTRDTGLALILRLVWCAMLAAIVVLLTRKPPLQEIRIYALVLVGGSILIMSVICLVLDITILLTASILLILSAVTLLFTRRSDLLYAGGFAIIFPNLALLLDADSRWRFVDYNAFSGAGLVLLFVLVHIRLNLLERSFALEYALRQKQRETDWLASVDPLTKVWNRRLFTELCARELARAERLGSRSAILMLDLDLFKRVNDTYGHEAGDAVLVAVAECWRAALRLPDILGRIGGEEFAVLLPDTPVVEAQRIAERLRMATEALRIDIGTGKDLPITVSIGCTVWATDEPLETAIKRADDALYEAKNAGRNRVVVART
jgi:diguanylate cyclase (GGDEF)-like protein